MKNILIINGHQPSENVPGKLNASYCEKAKAIAEEKGYNVSFTKSADGYDIDTEIEKHLKADVIFIQFPVNWMGMPWSLKKYMDEVYSIGVDGRLGNDDGRSRKAPKENYGMGGLLTSKYMLSVTFNAPREAFDNPKDAFFQGHSVDDLFYPIHQTLRFIGLSALPTFAAHDVHKNPEIESDFERFDAHLKAHI